MATAPALSFDVEANVSNFSRAMALVESTAKQRAAGFVLEFTGAGKKVDAALSDAGKGAAVRIGDALAGAAKRYEADFAKATQAVGANLTKGIAGAVRPVSFGAAGLVAGVAAVAVAAAAVTTAISQANDQLDRFIKLGDNAERAGIGVDFFQRFTEAAEAAKLSVAEIEAALKRAGQTVTPKFEQEDPVRKQLTDIFESGFTGQFQSKGLADYLGARDNETRIRAVVRAMQELRDLGLSLAAIDLGEKVFGADVADRLRSGRLEIDAIAASLDRQRADIISQEQVQQAEEFRFRLEQAYQQIDNALHVSVSLAGAGRDILNVWLAIAEATAKAATVAGSFLDKMAAAAKAARDAQPGSALQSPLASRPAQEGEGNLGADLGAVAGRSARGRTLYPQPIGPERPEMTIPNPPEPPRRPLDFYLNPEKAGLGGGAARPKAGGGAGTGADTLNQVESFINGVERSTEALKAEVDAIGKSSAERQSAINVARLEAVARQQGITLTEAQIAKVRELSEATANYRDALDDARDAQEALRSIGGDVLKGIARDAQSGANAMDVLTSAVARLAQRLGDRALDNLADSLFGKSGDTGGGGLLGSLLGGGSSKSSGGGLGDLLGFFTGAFSPIPKFATGTILSGPGTGTSDDILARVSNGEAIIPAASVARNRKLVEALVNDRVPRFAAGKVPKIDGLGPKDMGKLMNMGETVLTTSRRLGSEAFAL